MQDLPEKYIKPITQNEQITGISMLLIALIGGIIRTQLGA